MADITYRSLLTLRLHQFHALTPARTIADLCTLRSTELSTQDLLHGLAHLRLEPQRDSSSIPLGAFQDRLVVHREQKVGAWARIRCQLLHGEVEDVSSRRLDGPVQPFGVLGLVVLIGRDHTTPPQGTPGLPFSPCPVDLLPPVELGNAARNASRSLLACDADSLSPVSL